MEIAELDPLDERSVELYAAAVVANAGGLDISFNAIGLGDTQGVPLVEISHEHFALPIITAMKTHFCTTTTAARHMAKKRSGVIMAITAQAGRKPYRDVGGFGVACAAIEGLCRQLAVELGSLGIRVVCLRSAGSPDAAGLEEVWRRHGENAGISRQAFEASIAEHTLLKRLPKLDEIANAAVLVASDKASAITAAVANVTCGEIAD